MLLHSLKRKLPFMICRKGNKVSHNLVFEKHELNKNNIFFLHDPNVLSIFCSCFPLLKYLSYIDLKVDMSSFLVASSSKMRVPK